jgi:hypothetical protein
LKIRKGRNLYVNTEVSKMLIVKDQMPPGIPEFSILKKFDIVCKECGNKFVAVIPSNKIRRQLDNDNMSIFTVVIGCLECDNYEESWSFVSPMYETLNGELL